MRQVLLDLLSNTVKLTERGALVTTAADGGEALARLAAEPERFDVVVMDLQMPVMDGDEATRRIRQELQLKLPVIALTAGALVSERQRALEAGMSAFATKPLDPRSLRRLPRQQVERARGAPLPPQHRWASQAERGASAIPGLDVRHLPPDRAREPAQLAQLLEALLCEAERSARAEHLHKLRGSAAALGAQELADCAGALERALREADGGATKRARAALTLSAPRELTLPVLRQLAQVERAAQRRTAG